MDELFCQEQRSKIHLNETTASDRAGNEQVQRLHVPPRFEKALPKGNWGDIVPSEVPSKSQRGDWKLQAQLSLF